MNFLLLCPDQIIVVVFAGVKQLKDKKFFLGIFDNLFDMIGRSLLLAPPPALNWSQLDKEKKEHQAMKSFYNK